MIDTARCHRCKRQFPDHLVDDLITFSNGKKEVNRVCPICALDLTNKQHGMNRKEFAGPIANSMLNQARAYLEHRKKFEKNS